MLAQRLGKLALRADIARQYSGRIMLMSVCYDACRYICDFADDALWDHKNGKIA